MSKNREKLISGVAAMLTAATITVNTLSLSSCKMKENGNGADYFYDSFESDTDINENTAETDKNAHTDTSDIAESSDTDVNTDGNTIDAEDSISNNGNMSADDSLEGYDRPNIIFILLDDTGVADLGCYGNSFNETPNIDRISAEGTRFTSYYTQPVCSPSRSCLLTGQGTLRTGISNYLENKNSTYLDSNEFTLLPELLGDAGYHTCIIGKWHLCGGYENYPTEGSPYDAGFDEVIMSEQKYIGGGDYFYPYNHLPQVNDGNEGDYLIDAMNDAAVDYIERAADSEEPFFLYFSHYATHTTLDAPAETVEYFQNKRGTNGGKNTTDRNPYLAAMLKHIDNGIGDIDRALDRLGIKENTIVIIASDNGGSLDFTDNGIYRGGKSQLYEGGLKDPLIIRWPTLSDEARVTDFPVSVTDMYQTLGEAAGFEDDEIPDNIGVGLWGLVSGASIPEREALYWAFLQQTSTNETTNITYDTPFGGGVAIRIGDYKYIESLEYYRRELYDLSKDPGETKNIIAEYPELADSMAEKLHELLANDTVGKEFSATFDNNEYYRWNTSGTMTKSGGRFSSKAQGLSVVALEEILLYDIDMSASVSVGNTGSAGLIFRSTLAGPNKSSFAAYAVAISAERGTVELVNVTGQSSVVVFQAPCAIESGKTYNLRVIADSDEINVYLDGRLVLTCYNERYFHGGIGFYSENCAATFDDLSVKGIDGIRETTDIQINSKPAFAVNVRVNGYWLPSGTQNIRGTVCVKASELVRALGLSYVEDQGRLTFTYREKKAVLIKDGQSMVYGDSSVLLGVTPKEISGELWIPLSDVVSVMGLTVYSMSDVIAVTDTRIENVTYKDKRVKYCGTWTEIGGNTYRASKAGDYAELTFEGCGILLYLNRGDLACIFEVYIDGELVETVDAYNSTALYRSLMFETYDLSPGEHTIKVVNTGTCRAEGKGTNLNITAFEVIKYQ